MNLGEYISIYDNLWIDSSEQYGGNRFAWIPTNISNSSWNVRNSSHCVEAIFFRISDFLSSCEIPLAHRVYACVVGYVPCHATNTIHIMYESHPHILITNAFKIGMLPSWFCVRGVCSDALHWDIVSMVAKMLLMEYYRLFAYQYIAWCICLHPIS